MRSSLKMLYHVAAVVAIVHLLALVGAVGYLFATGILTPDRIDALAAVLRGDELRSAPQGPEATGEPTAAGPSEESIARKQTNEEIQRRAIRRGLSELRNKRVAINLVMQKALADKERFESERARAEAQARQRQIEEQEKGFKKTVEYLQSVKPAAAKDLLLFGNSDEEAARILLELDTRKGKKIIEAAIEDPVAKARMQKVFKMVRQLAPVGSEWSAVRMPEG